MCAMSRVFISYAHESDEQRERVAVLARRLRREGVDAWIDQFVEDDPPYWPTWMQDQIEQADYVLCVVSQSFEERFESKERMEKGKGVNWEGLVMTEAAYADLPQAHRKFIVVAFDTADLQHIPRVLLGAGRTAYLLYDYYHQLYRRITGQGQKAPPLGEIRQLEEGVPAEPTPELNVHSRPPFVPLRFLDRVRESGLLREAIQHAHGGCILVTGRPGIGKTAVVSRLLQDLEAGLPCGPIEFAYVSAQGSIPVSPDLLRTHLRPARSASDTLPPSGKTILVLDQAELLLDEDGDWKLAELGAFLSELAERRLFHLILLSRRIPSPEVLAALPHKRIAMTDGLPAEDARQLLLDADRECQLGLADAPAVIEAFLEQANGNPRALELIAAALVADPMLEPQRLAEDLAAVSDIGAELLGDSYQALSKFAHEIVSILAIARSSMPIDVLRGVVADDTELEHCLRKLASQEIVKYDRVNRRVRLDPFDVSYVVHQLEPEEILGLHHRIAKAAASIVDEGGLTEVEADTWAIAVVEHYLAADEPAEAAAELNLFQVRILERHGLYDQLVRLRERFRGEEREDPMNRVLLLRVLSLQGDFDRARQLVEASDSFVRERGDNEMVARWELEVGSIERDTGKGDIALERFRRVFNGKASARTYARALTAAAQLVRRQGDLDQSKAWLDQALKRLSMIEQHEYMDQQAEALALHQLAMIARFRRRQAEAVALLARSTVVSEAAEDRGGLAYRRCLRAALDSDSFEITDAMAALHLALASYDEIGDKWGAAAATAALAALEADSGNYEAATEHAAAAGDLARETGNIRVLGLLPAARLHVERRSGTLRPETRGLVVRGQRFLAANGYELYARRLEIDLLLHDFVVGAVDTATLRTGAPAPLEFDEREGLDDNVDFLLALCRPLAVFAPLTGQLPEGIATDVAMVLKA